MTGRTLGDRNHKVFHKKLKPTVWFFLIVSCSFKRVFKISSGQKLEAQLNFWRKKINHFLKFSPFKLQRSHSSWPKNTWIPTILNTEYLNSEANWILVTTEYSNFQVNWIQSECWIQGFAKLRAKWLLNEYWIPLFHHKWLLNE